MENTTRAAKETIQSTSERKRNKTRAKLEAFKKRVNSNQHTNAEPTGGKPSGDR